MLYDSDCISAASASAYGSITAAPMMAADGTYMRDASGAIMWDVQECDFDAIGVAYCTDCAADEASSWVQYCSECGQTADGKQTFLLDGSCYADAASASADAGAMSMADGYYGDMASGAARSCRSDWAAMQPECTACVQLASG